MLDHQLSDGPSPEAPIHDEVLVAFFKRLKEAEHYINKGGITEDERLEVTQRLNEEWKEQLGYMDETLTVTGTVYPMGKIKSGGGRRLSDSNPSSSDESVSLYVDGIDFISEGFIPVAEPAFINGMEMGHYYRIRHWLSKKTLMPTTGNGQVEELLLCSAPIESDTAHIEYPFSSLQHLVKQIAWQFPEAWSEMRTRLMGAGQGVEVMMALQGMYFELEDEVALGELRILPEYLNTVIKIDEAPYVIAFKEGAMGYSIDKNNIHTPYAVEEELLGSRQEAMLASVGYITICPAIEGRVVDGNMVQGSVDWSKVQFGLSCTKIYTPKHSTDAVEIVIPLSEITSITNVREVIYRNGNDADA